jgi:hypothetical protein
MFKKAQKMGKEEENKRRKICEESFVAEILSKASYLCRGPVDAEQHTKK